MIPQILSILNHYPDLAPPEAPGAKAQAFWDKHPTDVPEAAEGGILSPDQKTRRLTPEPHPLEEYRGEGWADSVLPEEGPAAPGEETEDTGDESMQGSWDPEPDSPLRGPESRAAMSQSSGSRSSLERVLRVTGELPACFRPVSHL